MPTSPPNSVHPKSRAEWRKWLEKNHTRTEGIWLISYKKETGKPRVSYEESVEEALCFGWIDSKGDGDAVVVLRSAYIDGRTVVLWAGAGIVAESDPDAELTETELKLATMLEALQSA